MEVCCLRLVLHDGHPVAGRHAHVLQQPQGDLQGRLRASEALWRSRCPQHVAGPKGRDSRVARQPRSSSCTIGITRSPPCPCAATPSHPPLDSIQADGTRRDQIVCLYRVDAAGRERRPRSRG